MNSSGTGYYLPDDLKCPVTLLVHSHVEERGDADSLVTAWWLDYGLGGVRQIGVPDEMLLTDDVARQHLSFVQQYVQANFSRFIHRAVEDLRVEALVLAQKLTGRQDVFPNDNHALAWLKQRNEQAARELRERLPLQVHGGDRRSKADLSRLRDHYERILPDWQEAFEICRTDLGSRSKQRRENWREAVCRAFPDLPSDLVERLQPMPEWPEEIADRCLKQGGMDKAEDIALEHAARLCGAAAYIYKLSSLDRGRKKRRSENQK